MSEADKSKSRRPSPKHTLDEVLRSLQDLVQNELAETRKQAAPTAWETPPDTEAATNADPSAPASAADGSPAAADTPAPWDATDSPTPNEVATHEEPAAESHTAPRAPEQTSINWDDIPVLNEVVMSPAAVAAPALPPSSAARELALKAVARLNIELRKAGNAPLPPAIIDRLEHILREALEAHAAEAPARPNEP